MKILINTPNWKRPELGGVANHYYGLRPYWTEKVKYNIVGSRARENTGKYWFPWDLLKTIWKLLVYNPDVLIVNTSLGKNALRRDSFFLNLATLFGKKVVVHFHGFNVNYAREINAKDFLHMFGKASGFLVLSCSIKEQLQKWGVSQPIRLTTTKVDNRMIDGYDVGRRSGDIKNILYLGRVEKEKGIYISLDVYALLQKNHPELNYTVVGSGTELENAKKYAKEIGIKNILFTGVLTGEALREQYENADLYLFTSFHEGMPTSVLEAMCFGLPIVTRPVGGLVDFFKEGEMGSFVDSFDARDFISPIEKLLNDKGLTYQIGISNNKYGIKHFLASQVTRNIENIILELC